MSAMTADTREKEQRPSAQDPAVSPPEPTALQRLIIDRMRERAWSYGAVARRGNMPRSTVHHLATTASPVRPPRPDTLEALARGLELPLSAVRNAAAQATGLHVGTVTVDSETAVLIASLEELTPEDRRHVAALIESLRSRSQTALRPGSD